MIPVEFVSWNVVVIFGWVIELAAQVKVGPLGYPGAPFWGFSLEYWDGWHRSFGFWAFSINWWKNEEMKTEEVSKVLEQYARSTVTEGNAAARLTNGDRLAFRELFTCWCLENEALATELGWKLHLASNYK